jgi:hypothetical protein
MQAELSRLQIATYYGRLFGIVWTVDFVDVYFDATALHVCFTLVFRRCIRLKLFCCNVAAVCGKSYS